MVRRKSHNENILNYLIRQGRRSSFQSDASYLILYAFLYKYLSDKLKNYIIDSFATEEEDLKFFYLSDVSEIREAALSELGYFIEDYDAYIDRFIGDKFVDDYIHPEFASLLKDNIIFTRDNPAGQYFNTITKTLERHVKYMTYDNQQELLISNYLLSISKLDIREEEFSFKKVYDLISYSRQIRITPTPEYITQILEKIILSGRMKAGKFYDPFLNDASVLFNVSRNFGRSKICAKEKSDLNYFYCLIKVFIHELDFSDVFLRNEDAVESMAFDDDLFDVIVSKIPNNFKYMSKGYKNRNLEAHKQNKVDIKEQLLSQFDLSELDGDEELLNALSIVEKKIEANEKSNVFDFKGEYESLRDSEFLFLINMLNCLKEDGMMAISVSQNFLFKKSLTTLRKFLTYEKNYIDTIISLPERLGRSIRPEVIIIFRKNRNFGDILFIDLSKKFAAVPSKNIVPGIFRRNLILDDATLDRIDEVLAKRQTIDQFSEVVNLRELEKNDFNLTVSRYVDTFEGDFIRLENLISTKKEIDEKMEELDKKIDLMMDDLRLK